MFLTNFVCYYALLFEINLFLFCFSTDLLYLCTPIIVIRYRYLKYYENRKYYQLFGYRGCQVAIWSGCAPKDGANPKDKAGV